MLIRTGAEQVNSLTKRCTHLISFAGNTQKHVKVLRDVFLAELLLLYYCFTTSLLLLYYFFTTALLLLYCQAIEWGVKVVNHLWLLDSITVWRWEPEAPYLAACGKEMLERRATLVLPLSSCCF
jgi:hypothetical protein